MDGLHSFIPFGPFIEPSKDKGLGNFALWDMLSGGYIFNGGIGSRYCTSMNFIIISTQPWSLF